MTSLKTLLLLAIVLAFAPSAPAQVLEKIPEVEIERETVVDEDGLQQWEPLQVECPDCRRRKEGTCKGCEGAEMPACTECSGTKTAPCRTCGGHGYLPDPIEEMACPFCKGSAWYSCGQCNGFGTFTVGDGSGGDNVVKCLACKKQGRYACNVCDGKRRLPTIRVKKKSPSDAKLKDLLKTREVLAACLEEIEPWEPLDRPAKSQKALEQLFAKPKRTFSSLGDMMELLDTVLGGIHKAGAQYQNYENRLNHQLLTFRNKATYLLRYQVRVLDLCIARAEHNEKVK